MSILDYLIPNPYKVHYLYIVPSDRPVRALDVIRKAAWHHQAWYQWRLGGKTFTIGSVETVLSQKNNEWFHTDHNNDGNQTFIANTKAEARAHGATIFGSHDDYICYVDAENQHGQAMGGMVGLAVMGYEDIEGLLGIHPSRTLCRQIGGDAHELGHSFGLHHPQVNDPLYRTALMGLGYGIYPSSILTSSDLATLSNHNFIKGMWTKRAPAGLCSFNKRLGPSPRPRPVIGPRP